MAKDVAPSNYNERLRFARADAVRGLGWADLVVRYSLPENVARLLVWSTAAQQEKMKDAQ